MSEFVDVSDEEELLGDQLVGGRQSDNAQQQNVNQDVEDLLTSFRKRWQKELESTSKTSPGEKVTPVQNNEEPDDYEQKARLWYLKGAEMERLGKLYEAIQWYKRAVQLVPDIDFKVQQKYLSTNPLQDGSDKDSEIGEHLRRENDEEFDEIDPKAENLLVWIQKKMSKCEWLCNPDYEQRSTHISSLPMEILFYILKWVVSSDLDLRSLEMCSMVSRGFYLCARDQEIWRLACIRAWGVNCGNLPKTYPSWRDMYIERARIHFSGCYISKTTYIRHGENSFQDQFYRPWHLVAYYRYLRFFPDGLVYMLTTPDEPSQCVGLLKNRTVKLSTILIGHYRLKDDKVYIVVQPQEVARQSNMYKRMRKKNDVNFEGGEQTFHLELRIVSYKNRRHIMLDWSHYTILTRNRNGTESQTSFETGNSRFPSLWFSRVKSYTQESSSPLQ